MTALPLFASLVLLAGADGLLIQADKMVEAKDCDALVDLFQAKKPSKTDKDLAYARTLVRGAQVCRAQDKVVAMALTEKALAYAPHDYGVQTAHAESMLALDQRTEAAQLLDDTIQDHPEGAVRARFLRGQLADEENEPAVAVQVMKPIAEDPEYGPKVQPLIARNEDRLMKQSAEKAEMKTEEDKLKEQAEKAKEIASSRLPSSGLDASGREIWTGRGTVKTGGSKSWSMKNLKANSTYVLFATGSCTQKTPKSTGRKKKVHFTREADTFSIDFRAKIGTLDPIPLKVGLSPERNSFTFRPLEDNPQLIIEDRGNKVPNVSCTITDVSVRSP